MKKFDSIQKVAKDITQKILINNGINNIDKDDYFFDYDANVLTSNILNVFSDNKGYTSNFDKDKYLYILKTKLKESGIYISNINIDDKNYLFIEVENLALKEKELKAKINPEKYLLILFDEFNSLEDIGNLKDYNVNINRKLGDNNIFEIEKDNKLENIDYYLEVRRKR